jgi:hypothetical protein
VLVVAGGTLPHSLPWYFGVAVFAAWAALLVALVFLVRRRLRARAGRLASRGRRASDVPDDRSVGPGNDLEVW